MGCEPVFFFPNELYLKLHVGFKVLPHIGGELLSARYTSPWKWWGFRLAFLSQDDLTQSDFLMF